MGSRIPFFIQEQFEIKSKVLLTTSVLLKGWYIVNLLFPLTSFQTFDFLSQNHIKLNSKDMIQSGWYRIYLNEEQISFLLKNRLASLYPIIREKTILSESDLYLVYASSDFQPSANQYSQIDENLFILSNISSIRNDPRVLKISPHSRPILENRYAGGYSENLNEIPSYDDQNHFLIPRPLHQIGLTGKGQVVAVSDSGLDTHHCFFYDPNVSAPFRNPNFNHRKIVLYDPVADDLDAERGHGTHVCGIIAGSSLCQNCGLDQYSGVAPGAKIYMHDLGDLKSGGGSIIDISVPYYVERMRVTSSFISSNSWGYSSGEDEIRAAFSKYAFNNPDILFLFACGNSYSSYTIHTPSNSKNVLAVGALTSPYGAFYDSARESIFFPSNNKKNHPTILEHNSGPTVSELMKASPSSSYQNKNVFIVNPDDPSTKKADLNMNQNIVIVDNSNIDLIFGFDPCTYALTMIKNASLIIFAKKLSDGCKPLNGSSINIPFLCVTNATIDKPFLYSLKTITVQPHYAGKREPVGKLGLSSQGPSNLGYTKPEIVASGQNILSSRAGPPYSKYPRECTTKTLVTKSGTSMAAPAASGIISMVRQFFVEGWYPSISKPSKEIARQNNKLDNQNIPFTPSSTLLRAFAVNSAKKIDTLIATGFGVMNPYEGLGFTGVGLRLANQVYINSSQHQIFKITVQNGGSPLTVTMSYLDPPLPGSSNIPLFADLDLVVVTPSGKVHKGNGFENKLDEDQFATTEKVIINKAEKGVFTIHILSSVYPMPMEVPYSIVINGNFKQTDYVTNKPFLTPEITDKCYSKCKYGKCVNGICMCDNHYYGHSCNKKAKLSTLKTAEPEMKNKIVKYFLFKVIDDKEKDNQNENIFTIKFVNKEKQGIGYCFNFDGKASKISEPTQECYFQTKGEQLLSFNSSLYPNIKKGNFIQMALYAVTCDYSYVEFTVSGVETHFSIVFWFIHLPLWMMITVASSVGLVCVLISIILMLIFIKPQPKKKRKKKNPAPKIDQNPNPKVIDHDPNDTITIDENLL